MESEVGDRVQYGQHSSPRARNARLLVISNLRFSKILRLEITHMSYDMKECGKRIQQLRIQQGYTQEKLAQGVNVDRSFMSLIESGKRGCSIDLLVQLSCLLNVSLDYLVLGKEYSNFLSAEDQRHLAEDVEKLIHQLESFRQCL